MCVFDFMVLRFARKEKDLPEAINRRTDNTMTKRKKTKVQQ
jgi:hypothetical protein